MKIAIDLSPLSYHMTGIERYAACITQKIMEQDKINEYILVFRNEIHQMFIEFIDGKRIKSKILRGNNKVFFLQVILPLSLYRIHADKYLFFAFTSPILFYKSGIYNTIHDMGAWDCPQAMSVLQKIYWRISYRVAAITSERIITVSNFSKERIASILNFPKDKISVVYSGVYDGVCDNEKKDFSLIKKIYGIPNKYILTLSTLEPRKNMEMLLQAFTEVQDNVDYNLVLVGRKGWRMGDVIKKYNMKSRIHITGFVLDEHLSLIYKNAMCFVFPSLYEGFGLPPIEALTMGTPVVASNAASIPEILMDRAIYFEKDSKRELKKILLTLNNHLINMPNTLNEFQKENYNFKVSAKKIINMFS